MRSKKILARRKWLRRMGEGGDDSNIQITLSVEKYDRAPNKQSTTVTADLSLTACGPRGICYSFWSETAAEAKRNLRVLDILLDEIGELRQEYSRALAKENIYDEHE